MKKLLLPIVILAGVASGLVGLALIRFAKNMEDWEASWDEDKENE